MSAVDWDDRYLEMAKLVAGWTKDPKAGVGAVVVLRNRVVATGFNGFPSAVLDTEERLFDKKKKLDMTVHAEENALLVALANARGADLYVYGKPVCCRCAASIIQAGIARVVAMSPVDDGSDWYHPGMTALKMFREARVGFDHMIPSSDSVGSVIELPSPARGDGAGRV